MGLATIDSYSQKEHNAIHNIPKFGVNQASPDAIHFFVNFDVFKSLYLSEN